MRKLITQFKNTLQKQDGSMPLALLMTVFIISASLLIASTTSLQIINNRTENTYRQAAWALDSTANLAAETMGSASRSLADLPTSAPAVWYSSDDGSYVYRWWIEGTSGVLAATAGQSHSCAIISDRTAKCWGNNAYGQLGNGASVTSSYPVTVSGLTAATQIAAAWNSTCALISDGTVKCWGVGTSGQLGNGASTTSNIPVTVSGITNAIQISAGRNNYCALLSTGSIKCWGDNGNGQLGNGTTTTATSPVTVTGITTAVEVSQGGNHACAILQAGTVQCWGNNAAYQLGDGTTTQRTTPVTVTGILDAVDVAAGHRTTGDGGSSDGYTCLTTVAGGNQLKCWGNNAYGQLGMGNTTSLTAPTNVPGVNNVKQIVAGTINTCTINSTKAVQCWGNGGYGQLGNGTTTSSNSPITITTLPATTSLATMSYVTMGAVADDGKLYMWGYNNLGQVGDGTTVDKSVPTAALTLGPYALTPTAKMQIKLKSVSAAGLTSDAATFQAATSYVWNPVTNSWDTLAYYSQY